MGSSVGCGGELPATLVLAFPQQEALWGAGGEAAGYSRARASAARLVRAPCPWPGSSTWLGSPPRALLVPESALEEQASARAAGEAGRMSGPQRRAQEQERTIPMQPQPEPQPAALALSFQPSLLVIPSSSSAPTARLTSPCAEGQSQLAKASPRDFRETNSWAATRDGP